MLVIVPDSLEHEIQKRLDAAIARMPDAEKDRGHLRQQLLQYFNEHGFLPSFTIEKTT